MVLFKTLFLPMQDTKSYECKMLNLHCRPMHISLAPSVSTPVLRYKICFSPANDVKTGAERLGMRQCAHYIMT